SASITDAMLLPHVVRILEQKYRFKSINLTGAIGLKPATTSYSGGSIGNNASHIDIAERAAAESMVLLKNCPVSNKTCTTADDPARVLPIKKDGSIKSIAVVGATMTYSQMGTNGPG